MKIESLCSLLLAFSAAVPCEAIVGKGAAAPLRVGPPAIAAGIPLEAGLGRRASARRGMEENRWRAGLISITPRATSP